MCSVAIAGSLVGKKKNPNRRRLGFLVWWRWAESNRRPKALHPRYYMLSPPLDLAPRQHDVRSAPGNQPVSSTAEDRQPPRLVPVIVTLHPQARAQVGSGLTP